MGRSLCYDAAQQSYGEVLPQPRGTGDRAKWVGVSLKVFAADERRLAQIDLPIRFWGAVSSSPICEHLRQNYFPVASRMIFAEV